MSKVKTERRVGCKGCKHLIHGPNFYAEQAGFRCAMSFYVNFDPYTGNYVRSSGQTIAIANKFGRCKKREEFKQ